MPLTLTPADINRVSGVPLFNQLADRIRHAIETGELAPDEALPAEAEMKRAAAVSITVVKAATAELARDGLIIKQSGSLTRVAKRPPVRIIDTAGGDPDWTDYRVTTDYRREKATEREADLLDIKPADLVLHRDLLDLVDGQPVQIRRSTVPLSIARKTILEQPSMQPYPGGVVAELAAAGHQATEVIVAASTRPPTGDERMLLQLVQPVHVWDIVRVMRTDTKPVETAQIITPAAGSQIRFTTQLH